MLANWSGAADSEANIAWARDMFAALEPYGSGKVNMRDLHRTIRRGVVRRAALLLAAACCTV
jgi:hypothetical protein